MTQEDSDAVTPAETPDVFVPDPQVCLEFGGVTLMALYRWTNDPDLGFPPPVKMHGRNYRSRRQLEAFKLRMLERALRERNTRPRPRPRRKSAEC